MKLSFFKKFKVEAVSARAKWYHNYPADIILAISLLFVVTFWIIWIILLGPQAYFLLTPIFAERSGNLVFVLPATSTFIFLLNWLLYVFSYKKLKGAAYTFLATNLLAQILIMLVTIYYLLASK